MKLKFFQTAVVQYKKFISKEAAKNNENAKKVKCNDGYCGTVNWCTVSTELKGWASSMKG